MNFLEETIDDIKSLALPKDLEAKVIKTISDEYEATGNISFETLEKLYVTAQEESLIPYDVDPNQFQIDEIQTLSVDEARQLSKMFSQFADKQIKFTVKKQRALESNIKILNYNTKVIEHNHKIDLINHELKSVKTEANRLKRLIEAEESKFFLFKNSSLIAAYEEELDELKSKYKNLKRKEKQLGSKKEKKSLTTVEGLTSSGEATKQIE